MNQTKLLPLLALLTALALTATAVPAQTPYRDPAKGDAALELEATDATGSATVNVLAAGYKRCVIGVRVVAYAGWGGTVTLSPKLSADDDSGGVPTSFSVGDLDAAGTVGVADYEVTGAWSVSVSVSGNDRAMDVVYLCHDIREQ